MKTKEHINEHLEEIDDTKNSEATPDLIHEKGGNPMPPRKLADIGAQLQTLRLKAGLIQADVAAALGLKPNSFAAISRWETGRVKVPRKHYAKLRELYGLPHPNEHRKKKTDNKTDTSTLVLAEQNSECPYTGFQLKTFREKAGLTQTDVAIALGFPSAQQSTISRWETERVKVPRKHYAKLTELYRLPHPKEETDEATPTIDKPERNEER